MEAGAKCRQPIPASRVQPAQPACSSTSMRFSIPDACDGESVHRSGKHRPRRVHDHLARKHAQEAHFRSVSGMPRCRSGRAHGSRALFARDGNGLECHHQGCTGTCGRGRRWMCPVQLCGPCGFRFVQPHQAAHHFPHPASSVSHHSPPFSNFYFSREEKAKKKVYRGNCPPLHLQGAALCLVVSRRRSPTAKSGGRMRLRDCHRPGCLPSPS